MAKKHLIYDNTSSSIGNYTPNDINNIELDVEAVMNDSLLHASTTLNSI